MDQANSLASFDWQAYLGCGLFTADNQRVGVVKDLRTDPRSGEVFLIVQDNHPSGVPLCVPATKIGIVTRFRLMLDLVSKQVPVREWRENNYGDLMQA